MAASDSIKTSTTLSDRTNEIHLDGITRLQNETEDRSAIYLEDDFRDNVQSLPIHSLRPSEIRRRCSKCGALSADNLIPRGPPVPHHRSFLDLEVAALAGCEICSLFLWNVPITNYKYCPEERRLLYEKLRASDEPLFIGWGYSGLHELLNEPPPLMLVVAEDIETALSCIEVVADVNWLSHSTVSSHTDRLELLGGWVESCLDMHEDCRARRNLAVQDPRKPSRLIDVGTLTGADDPRLVLYNSDMTDWAALSYVWGTGIRTMITTKENIEERMKCIPMLAMPKTFREAVELCRHLHIPYLWIDALCIIQPNGPDGDDEDWQNQSAIINQIYGQALLTIAATDAANVHQGCFTTPSSRLGNVPKSCHLFASKSLQTMVLKPEYPNWWQVVSDAPLGGRGWTFQEQMLSLRVVHCTELGIFWECDSIQASEFHGELEYTGLSRIRHLFSGGAHSPHKPLCLGQTLHLTKETWSSIVTDYSQRQLTFKSDRLLALSSVAQHIGFVTGDEYLAGLWRSAVFSNLLWYSWGGSSTQRFRLFPRPLEGPVGGTLPNYVAPSWSWASVMGEIMLEGEKNLMLTKYGKFLSASVTATSAVNPYGQIEPGATLRIASRVRHGAHTGSQLECSSKAPSLLECSSIGSDIEDSDDFAIRGNSYSYDFAIPKDNLSSTGESTAQSGTGDTHQGCIRLDSPEDWDVEFSLLLMTVNTPEWLQDESLAHPSRPSYTCKCGLQLQYDALAIASTGNPSEYRRIGYAEIHERSFFVGTSNIEVNLV